MRVIEILLIEDNFVDILLIEEVFEEVDFFYCLYVVCDGVEVLIFLWCEENGELFMFDVILFDFNMLCLSGFELFDIFKEDLQFQYILVIVLIIFCVEEDVWCSYKLYVNVYIFKLVFIGEFVEVICLFGNFWFSVVVLFFGLC